VREVGHQDAHTKPPPLQSGLATMDLGAWSGSWGKDSESWVGWQGEHKASQFIIEFQ
tara:strand:- start:2117 stop:2287 length:171 start_codon:yes stop_codon:yes gene_type:complete